jgi:single-stranded-DNA-specific exonuclease
MPDKFQVNTDTSILARRYASDFSLPRELAEIVAQRFQEYDKAKRFLSPEESHLHDVSTMPDISSAVDVICTSLQNQDGILVYCHDDPDGYTSGVLMYKALLELSRGSDNRIFLYPIVREKDGYILNPDVIRDYKQKGVKLVVTVDFGISSQETFSIAQDEGVDIIVCDHHETHEQSFERPAVDPKRPGSRYPFRNLAGVGVSFKLAQALYERVLHLSPDEFYGLKKEFFVLAMVGTIADRVVVLDENRVFCVRGLQLAQEMDTPWIRIFRRMTPLTFTSITGIVIPTISSAAYCNPEYGVDFLLEQNEERLNTIIKKLMDVTAERRRGIADFFVEVVNAAKIFPGIVLSVLPFTKQHYLGSSAARLRDQYQRLSVVVGLGEGKCHGELRSNEIDLFEMLSSFRHLFLDFGGHRKAAGFTMNRENLDRFERELIEYVSGHEPASSKDRPGLPEYKPVFLQRSNIQILTPLAPFGEGNPAPLLTDGSSIYTIDNKFNIIEKG